MSRPLLRRRRSILQVGAGVVVALAVATAAAPGAAAADLWWATGFNLAKNHTIATGKGVTVAVIDGPFSSTAPSVQGIDLVPPSQSACLLDNGTPAPPTGDGVDSNHATAMVATLAGQGTNGPLGAAPGAKVLVYNSGASSTGKDLLLACNDKDGKDQSDTVVAAAINDAVSKGARIVSMSFGGGNLTGATSTAIGFAERKGVVFVAATDDKADAKGSRVDQPASLNGVVAVNGIDASSKLIPDSATGQGDGQLVAICGPGGDMALGGYDSPGAWDPGQVSTGSSAATAFVAGVLATTLSKYPQATGNQLIQSLARNTGGDQHDPVLRGTDGFGWGTVSLTSMLQNDPTAYPDENPLLRDGAQPPTSDIVDGSSSASPSTSASSGAPASSGGPSASASPVASADSGSSTGLVVGIVVGAVVVLAGVALAIVLTRRGRRGPPNAGNVPPPPVPSGHR